MDAIQRPANGIAQSSPGRPAAEPIAIWKPDAAQGRFATASLQHSISLWTVAALGCSVVTIGSLAWWWRLECECWTMSGIFDIVNWEENHFLYIKRWAALCAVSAVAYALVAVVRRRGRRGLAIFVLTLSIALALWVLTIATTVVLE